MRIYELFAEDGIPELEPPEDQTNPSPLRKGLNALNTLFTAKKVLSGGPEAVADQELNNFIRGIEGDASSRNQSYIHQSRKENVKEGPLAPVAAPAAPAAPRTVALDTGRLAPGATTGVATSTTRG